MMRLPAFEVILPSTLEEAAGFLADHHQQTKIYAGGTDLVPSMKQGLFEPDYVLDIKSLPGLNGITDLPDGGVRIGALTTVSELAASPVLRREFPVLARAAATVAGPNLRNAGTLGGNICLDTRCYWYNQSFFWRSACGFCIKKDGSTCHVAPGSKQCWAVYSGDTAPALMVLGGRVKLTSRAEERVVPLTDFFVNDGLGRNVIRPDEILTEVLIPAARRGYAGHYEKFRVRGSVDYPLAGVAASGKPGGGGDLRIGLTAVNPRPVLLDRLDGLSLEDICNQAKRTAKPLKTSASTMEYRRHMIGVLVKRAIRGLSASSD